MSQQKCNKKQEKKEINRKPYQVAITTQHSSGYRFKRVRGWVQPVQTAMMLKSRVKTNQIRLDKLFEYKSQLEMVRSERLFLSNLGCLPSDKLHDMGMSVLREIAGVLKYFSPFRKYNQGCNKEKHRISLQC